jgi:hypothetical protein
MKFKLNGRVGEDIIYRERGPLYLRSNEDIALGFKLEAFQDEFR